MRILCGTKPNFKRIDGELGVSKDANYQIFKISNNWKSLNCYLNSFFFDLLLKVL